MKTSPGVQREQGKRQKKNGMSKFKDDDLSAGSDASDLQRITQLAQHASLWRLAVRPPSVSIPGLGVVVPRQHPPLSLSPLFRKRTVRQCAVIG